MNFEPSPKQAELLGAVRRIVRDRVAPQALAWDRAATVATDALRDLGAAGASGIYVAKEHGGLGLDTASYALVIEEVSSELPALGTMLSVHNSLYGSPLQRFGTAAQKQAFLRPVAAGERIGAFALTEAEAGSDAVHLETVATRQEGGYLLRGEKVMVTNGGIADFTIVIAATDPGAAGKGLTAFVVPMDRTGVHRGVRVDTMGLRSADVRSLTFQDVELEEGLRLGEENRGLAVVLEALNAGRIGIAAQAVGIARGAYERALAYARTRRQFGRFLHEIAAVQEMLAGMVTEIDAARLTTYWAAQLRDAGSPEVPAAAARAKLTASEMCGRVTSQAIQIHGGWGYLTQTGVERFHRDAKITEIYEGTSEMLRQTVTAALVKG